MYLHLIPNITIGKYLIMLTWISKGEWDSKGFDTNWWYDSPETMVIAAPRGVEKPDIKHFYVRVVGFELSVIW